MQHLKLSVILALLLHCFYCQGQKTNRDSLSLTYKDHRQTDPVRLIALRTIAMSYLGNDPDSAIILAKELQQFSSQRKNLEFEGRAYYIIGSALFQKGSYNEALEAYGHSIELAEKANDKSALGDCYSNIGLVAAAKSDYTQALKNYLKALQIREEIGDKEGVGISYVTIGYLFADQADYEKAMDYFLKALKERTEVKDSSGIADVYNSIGNVCYYQSNYDKALDWYTKALTIQEANGGRSDIADLYSCMGSVYNEKKDYSRSLEYYKKALSVYREIGNQDGICITHVNMSEVFYKTSDYPKVILYCDSALQLNKEIGDMRVQGGVLEFMAKANGKMGNYKEAYELQVKLKKLTDSIFNADNSKQLSDLKTKYEVDKKESELKAKADATEAINREEKKRQRFTIYAVAGILMIVVAFSILLYRRFRLTQVQKKIIEIKSKELEEKNKDIMDSIHYARRIQRSLLPTEKYIQRILSKLS